MFRELFMEISTVTWMIAKVNFISLRTMRSPVSSMDSLTNCLYFSLFLCLVGFSCPEDLPPLKVQFKPSGTVKAQKGEQLIFGCEINRNLLFVSENIVSIIRKSATEESEVIVSQLPKNVTIDPNYSVKFDQVHGNGVFITINISQVRDLDEGKFICRVLINDGSASEDVLDVQIKKPEENIYVKFGNYDPVSSSKVDPIQVDTGNYPMVCTAEGSNPAPTVHLYLDGKHIHKFVSQSTKFRTVVTANVSLPFSNSVHTVECAADLQVGNKSSVKLSFKTKIYDPEITCNDSEAYPGQKQPILTCTVDYEGLKIKSFRYELGDIDNRHSGATNADFEQVSQEHLSDTKTRVHLKLKMAEDWHFETEFYLVAEHEDGHITRQTVRLRKIPGPANSSTIVHYLLMTLVVPFASWLN